MPRRIAFIPIFVALSALVVLGAKQENANDPQATDIDRRFSEQVRPFITAYCIKCHSGDKPKGDFKLDKYSDLAAVTKDAAVWATIRERLVAKEMPPPEAKTQP